MSDPDEGAQERNERGPLEAATSSGPVARTHCKRPVTLSVYQTALNVEVNRLIFLEVTDGLVYKILLYSSLHFIVTYRTPHHCTSLYH